MARLNPLCVFDYAPEEAQPAHLALFLPTLFSFQGTISLDHGRIRNDTFCPGISMLLFVAMLLLNATAFIYYHV